MKFSSDIVDQVKTSTDIVTVISEYFPLKRSGRNFKALCPFHDERTPSFMVNPERQIFHCFGCGAGGDVIAFVMRQEGYSFPEALRHLAERAGMSLPSNDPAAASRHERLLSLHDLAAGFFRWGLSSSRYGARARAYLEKRGISESAAEQFGLGYAQASWDSFSRHARKKGFSVSELVAGGLALEREDGGIYDRFRDRLVIPIRNPRGKTIGFGARVLDDSTPKYINSPETELFHKGQVLFGLDLARRSLEEAREAILGEGYLDVIRAHQEGLGNVVCSQGTAFTPEQARLLKRHVRRVVTAFDADAAGRAAALKGLDIFLAENLEVAIALLPSGEDPDSFIRARGAQAFRELVREARPLLDYKLETLYARHEGDGDRGKLEVARDMLSSIDRIQSPILREAAINRLASRLGVSPLAVREEFRLLSKPPAPAPARASSLPGEKNERNLLKLLFQNDTISALVSADLDAEDFSPELRPLAQRMIEGIDQGEFPLVRTLPAREREEKIQALLARWMFEEPERPAEVGEVIDYLAYLKRKRLQASCRELDLAIAEGERAGSETAHLQRRRLELAKEARAVSRTLREKYEK